MREEIIWKTTMPRKDLICSTIGLFIGPHNSYQDIKCSLPLLVKFHSDYTWHSNHRGPGPAIAVCVYIPSKKSFFNVDQDDWIEKESFLSWAEINLD
jgi:hypothetical protein